MSSTPMCLNRRRNYCTAVAPQHEKTDQNKKKKHSEITGDMLNINEQAFEIRTD